MYLKSLRPMVCVAGLTLWVAQAEGFQEPAKPAEQPAKPAEPSTPTADAPKPAEKEAKPAKPPVHKVTKGPFKVEVSVKGVFEATKLAEVILRPEVWKSFEVVDAADHGARVKKGDRLVTLDMKRIDEEIRSRKHDLEISSLTLKQAQEEMKYIEVTAPLDREAGDRAKKAAAEDLVRFLQVERPQSEKIAKFSLDNYKYYLEYAQEELKQLEKMYKADDLTEETEEIILKRAQRDVEGAEFSLDASKIRTERTLNIDLPRREIDMTEATKRISLAQERAAATLPITLERQKLNLEKAKREQKKSEENLANLEQDRKLMDVLSPAEGIVYYGKSDRGKWAGSAAMAQQLRQGGSVAPNQVFMSIVQPQPMILRIDVAEKDLEKVRPGVTGKVVPAAFADLKLECAVQEVSPVPISPGTFDGKLTVKLGDKANAIVPGMACSIDLVPYEKKDAIAVPKATVFTDEKDETKQYVYVAKADGTHEKRNVETGKKTDDKTEILSGLAEGDEILLKKPADNEGQKPAETPAQPKPAAN